MALFSQRKGLKPLEKPIQRESLDTDLRRGLWNSALVSIFAGWKRNPRYYDNARFVHTLLDRYWLEFVKGTIDEIPLAESMVEHIKQKVLQGEWSDTLDLLEFLEKTSEVNTGFTRYCNEAFQRENAAYRFVGEEITEITSTTEIETLEAVVSSGVSVVEEHIQSALSLLSDRKNPDYRNAIKEAISAVEGLCKKIAGGDQDSLSKALKKVGGNLSLHESFQKGVLALYGFTSDAGGIRHARKDEQGPSYSEAKFMVVLASAICNFLLAKCAENGIKIG